MACPHAKRCSLYAQLGTRSALTVWQTLFCESGFDRCVRYRLTTAGAFVPADLLPDGRSHLPRDVGRDLAGQAKPTPRG